MEGRWGLWMLLLLQLHLVVCAPLPAPSNVSISSFNMEHMLSFLPGPETPPDTFFAVEILPHRKKSWRAVTACSKLTAGQTCNLTRAFKDWFDDYLARVQAFTTNQRSKWTTSLLFHPLSDTVVGPPDMSVSGCGNCLLLQLRSIPSILRSFHGDLVFNVQRTRDGAQFKLNLQYKEEIVITYLEPGVEYCVTVMVNTIFNTNTVPSKPHCAFTSPPPTTSSLLVYGLLGTFCALGLLLFGFMACDSQLSLKLRRLRLVRALSYFLLQGQKNLGSATSDLSGQTSASQRYKEGSADCLLTAHRPGRSPWCSSEDGEEDCRL